jgi:Lar family restriction alleviation protein
VTYERCPFCSSRKLSVESFDRQFYVSCHGCEANGPLADSESGAVRKWNARPHGGDGDGDGHR